MRQAMASDPRLAAAMAALSTPAGQKVATAKLEKLMADMSQGKRNPKAERQAIELVAQLNASGQLVPVLTPLAEAAWAKGALPPATDAEKKVMVEQLANMIDAQLGARGMTPTTQGVQYISWEDLSRAHLDAVRATAVPPAGPGSPSAFDNPVFVAELEKLMGKRFADNCETRLLINGPASFAERDRMIDNATTSIHLMTWAFYDDDTGWGMAKKLVAAKARGVDVKIIVDAEVAREPVHQETLKFMEQNGINVVRYSDPTKPHDGHHRKVMVVDGVEAVAGGMNIGNVYSHRGPETDPKWRDTDVLMRGTAVGQASALFAELWNEQLAKQQLDYDRCVAPPAPAGVGAGRAALVDDRPGPDDKDPSFLAMLKSIEGATTQVDIENAYVILTPALRDVLKAAIARGVKVRVLSNSAESVDVPIISAPILASLKELREAGAEVYLKKGATLHSKFLQVDSKFVAVGSYNFHPQSERYKGETTVMAIDAELATKLREAFEQDIQAATPAVTADEIKVPESALTSIVSMLFFDHL